jgi:hypothetical protein
VIEVPSRCGAGGDAARVTLLHVYPTTVAMLEAPTDARKEAPKIAVTASAGTSLATLAVFSIASIKFS